MLQPIVVTGLGVLACNGIGREPFWDAIANGRSGIRRLDRFDASELPCQIGGQLWDFNPEDFMKKTIVQNWQRYVHQAIAASKLAVEDAGLSKAGYAQDRVAVSMATSVGNPNEMWQSQLDAFNSRGYKKISKYASSASSGHSATVHVTIDLGFSGPALTIASGCAAGLDVVTWGASQIRRGKADAALVGATESPLFLTAMAAACSLGILSKRNDEPEKAMRPFDRNRDGIVLSEAAVVLVLERADHAVSRGAPILAEIAGNGSASDASSPLLLDPEGKALARAMEASLNEAGLKAEDVDHVQAHGVSLEMYDRCETNAIKSALGEQARRVPITAIKSMTGQPYSVGGLLGVSAALMAISKDIVAPTINLDDPDPECDLDFVPQRARVNDVNVALVNGISFGGTYSACLLKKFV